MRRGCFSENETKETPLGAQLLQGERGSFSIVTHARAGGLVQVTGTQL